MASLMSLLTGHQPGAFEGFRMKDLFDKDRWDREQRTWSGQRTPTGPSDLRTTRGGEPMMTNWYKGREVTNPGQGREFTNPIMLDREMPITPNPQMVASTMAAPWANAQSQMLPDPRQAPARMAPVRDRPFPMPSPPSMMSPQQVGTPTGPEYNRPPPNYIQRTLDTGIPGYFGRPDTVATEEEVEAMNAYRGQMLADLLAETSEEPEVKPISYYRKKKRSPKTWRSKSRGYRLKRV